MGQKSFGEHLAEPLTLEDIKKDFIVLHNCYLEKIKKIPPINRNFLKKLAHLAFLAPNTIFRKDILNLLIKHHSYGDFLKAPRGRQNENMRNIIIASLVTCFRLIGLTREKAFEEALEILSRNGNQLSWDGLESAYKAGKKLLPPQIVFFRFKKG